MINKFLTIAVFVGSVSAFAGTTREETAAKLNHQDLVEIAASEIALAKSTRADIVAYANRVIPNHVNANVVIHSVARGESFALGQSDEFAAKLAALQPLQGSEFERGYAQLMVDVHVWALSVIDQAASEIPGTAVTSFGLVVRDRVQKGLDLAQELLNNSK